MEADDAYWRQPGADKAGTGPASAWGGQRVAVTPPSPQEAAAWSAPAQGQPLEPSAPAPTAALYRPAPVTASPPPGWRPGTVIEPAPPRRLPGQDHAAIDQDEARARRFTWSAGGVLGVLLLVFLCMLCGQFDLNF